MTDNTGTVHARYAYDPYGRMTQLSGNLTADFGFTGSYFHGATGLNLTLYRAYDPNLGRWLSRDPIEENGGLNLYRYAGDNPINLVDPLGLWTFGFGGEAGGGAGAGGSVQGGFFVGHTAGAGFFSGWSFGILGRISGGAYVGQGYTKAGVFMQFTNADNVCQLKGKGFNYGGSGGEGFNAGVEYNRGLQKQSTAFYGYVPTYTGVTISGGVGGGTIPGEIHGQGSQTGGWVWGGGP
jgi:RHS repeat-associated protein